jgi:hypothetical protein
MTHPTHGNGVLRTASFVAGVFALIAYICLRFGAGWEWYFALAGGVVTFVVVASLIGAVIGYLMIKKF